MKKLRNLNWLGKYKSGDKTIHYTNLGFWEWLYYSVKYWLLDIQ